jgi:hypothetical protein
VWFSFVEFIDYLPIGIIFDIWFGNSGIIEKREASGLH